MIEIRPATANDLDQAMDLVRACYGDAAEPRDWWRWRHFDRLDRDTVVLLAEESGEVVGMRPFSLFPYLHEQRPITGALFSAVMVHPAHRRRGIFKQLVTTALDEAWRRGASFAMTMPNDRSFPGFVGLGWHDLGDRPLLARPILGRRAVPGVGVSSVDVWSEDVDDLLERCARQHTGASLLRSREWLTWRYHRAPWNRYQLFEARDANAQLNGVAVTNQERRWRLELGYLIDIVAVDVDTRRALIDACVRDLGAHRARLAVTVVSEASFIADLQRRGFRRVPQLLSPKRFHTVLREAEGALLPQNLDGWSLTLGDWDGI